MSQKRALAQEIRLGSPDRFSSWEGGVWDETKALHAIHIRVLGEPGNETKTTSARVY